MRLAIQGSASDEDMAHAAAMVMTFRTLGISLSLAILGVIFQNFFKRKLETLSFRGQIGGLSKSILGVVEVIKKLPTESPDKLVLRQVFAESLKMIWLCWWLFSWVSLISSFFTEELSLSCPERKGTIDICPKRRLQLQLQVLLGLTCQIRIRFLLSSIS